MFSTAGFIANTILAQYLAILEVIAAGFFVIAFAANIIIFWVMAPRNSTSEVSELSPMAMSGPTQASAF